MKRPEISTKFENINKYNNDFLEEIKEIQSKMKIFSLRTANKYYKEKIQELIEKTKHIIIGTKDLPLRIEIIERNIMEKEDMPRCANEQCNNIVYSFDDSKLKFCSRKCQCVHNSHNMNEESVLKATRNRNYKDISHKRKITMKNDIINGKNAHKRSSEKAAKSHDYKTSSAKAAKTMTNNGTYKIIGEKASKRLKEIQDNGKTKALNHWNNFYKNKADDEYFRKRNKKIRNTRIKNGDWVAYEDKSDWELYSFLVRKLTEQNYKKHKDIIDPGNIREHLVYDLDHIVSVKKGFNNNIPIHIIAGVDNLQMLDSILNRKKGFK